jgi:hypothetical protein
MKKKKTKIFKDIDLRKNYHYVFVNRIQKTMLRLHSKIKVEEQKLLKNLLCESINNIKDDLISSADEENEECDLSQNKAFTKTNYLNELDIKELKSKGFVYDTEMKQYYDPKNGLYYDHVN